MSNNICIDPDDIKSLLSDTQFMHMLIDTMSIETKELYYKELARKAEERSKRIEQGKIDKDNDNEQKRRYNELLDNILSYLWLSYVIITVGMFMYYILRIDNLLIGWNITQGPIFDGFEHVFVLSIGLVFVFIILSCFILMFFSDF